MIEELAPAVLTRDVPESGLTKGDVGTVVHAYQNGQAYEVEFATLLGETIAVLTLESKDVEPVGNRQIAHARDLRPTA